MNNQFSLPRDIQLQVTAAYYAPKNIPKGRQSARSSLDIGIKKPLFEGKGEITLTGSDLFNRFGIEQQIVQDGFTVLYQNFYETQVFRLGLKYKF